MNKSKLITFLNENFQGLELRLALFYFWNIGIRFDLQQLEEEDSIDEKYFQEVVRRAKTIYESIFDKENEIIVVYQNFCWRKQKIRKSNYLFKQISGLSFNDIFFHKIKGLYEQNETWKRAMFETKVKNINHENIFKDISNQDFPPRKPVFVGDLFLINISKKIIFNMYDDRGIDIISTDKNKLVKLYNNYSSWVSEFDAEKINNLFK